MRGNIPFFAVERFQHFKLAILLCLLCSLVMNACVTNTSRPTPTMAIPIPTINAPNGRCELAPGESLQLAVTGVAGDDIVYSWIAGAGSVTPTDGLVVKYTAPNTGGDVIIRVDAKMDGQASAGVITCVVIPPTPTATTTATSTPTETPTPTETLPSNIIPTIVSTPNQNATYAICDLGNGRVRVTLNPPEDNGEYSYSPSKVFEAQINDLKEVVVKSRNDRRVWATIIHIVDKDYSDCSSAPTPSADNTDRNGSKDGDEDGDGGVIPLAPY